MPNPDVPPQRTLSGGALWFPWLWPQEPDMALWWIGPGTHLFLCLRPYDPTGKSVVIEHPTACDTYDTLAEATAAMKRFVKACDPEEQAEYIAAREDGEEI